MQLGLEATLLKLCIVLSLILAAYGVTAHRNPDCDLLRSIHVEGQLVLNEKLCAAGGVGGGDGENRVVEEAATDFGRIRSAAPCGVLFPSSVADIAAAIKSIYTAGAATNLTVAAKGGAHSLYGQAQARDGLVVEVSALPGDVSVHISGDASGRLAYVDAPAGALWIDVLRATLRHGLAPRSWTDYLYLTVGGTLSNAGISGQAFRHGPQISNVYQLEVVTGKGDVVLCSPHANSDLFYAALGGLGQFGVITSARLALEPAPQRVKWIRVLYSDWNDFVSDQEYLISQPAGRTFDYVEGFVVAKDTGSILDNWRSLLFKAHIAANSSTKHLHDNDDEIDRLQSIINSQELLYYLEVTLNYNEADGSAAVEQRVAELLQPLHCTPAAVYSTDVSYVEFLDRVHTGELKLREEGLWEIPHPWLNLFVPKSKITEFNDGVFKQILAKEGGGPVIVYPMNRNKWDERMSAVTPDEDVFYLVALLRSPGSDGATAALGDLVQQNQAILRFCKEAGIGEKQYLPGQIYGPKQWQGHFGPRKWRATVARKARYDPAALLSPGHNMFNRHVIRRVVPIAAV